MGYFTTPRGPTRPLPEEGWTKTESPGAEVYTSDVIDRTGATAYYAKGFIGKRQVGWHYRFRSDESRAKYVGDFFQKVAKAKAKRAVASAQRAAFTTSLKVGDILSYIWGYEQTNVDFFQVVRVTGKATVELRPIQGLLVPDAGVGPMTGKRMPVKDAFTGAAIRKRVHAFGDRDSISMDYGVAWLWDGRPESVSWYA